MKRSFRTAPTRSSLVLIALALSAPGARANHGPGTSGSGSNTISGETLKAGQFEFSLRTDSTWYESFSRAQAEQHAIQSDGFDALERALVTNVGFGWGVTDDFQLGAQIGMYNGTNFIDAEPDGGGGAESAVADPAGWTDLWLSAKYRVARGPFGNVALLAGVKLPTGKDDETLSNDEELEPSSQPGTGAVDGQLGAAWSRYLTPRVTLDLSGAYTLRGKAHDFEVGDRLDLGVAAGYRLTRDIQQHPTWSLTGELQGVWIGKDEAGGDANENSGGWTLYAAAGVRVRFNENVALTIAPAVPIYQDLNGDQAESRARLSISLAALL